MEEAGRVASTAEQSTKNKSNSNALIGRVLNGFAIEHRFIIFTVNN